MEQTNQNLFELQFDHQSSAYLVETAKWNKFLAIVWFIICGLMAIASIFMGSIFAGMYSSMSTTPGMGALGGISGIVVTVFYLIFTAIQLIPTIYRYKFAVKMLTAIRTNDQQLLNESLNSLRIYTKYWGILTIIILAFYILIILFGLLGLMMGR